VILFCTFRNSDFGFVSDFELRISIFNYLQDKIKSLIKTHPIMYSHTDVIKRFFFTMTGFAVAVFFFRAANAAELSSFAEQIDLEWGGHIKMQGKISDVDDRSIFKYAETGHFADWACDLRLKNKISFKKKIILEFHYEAVLTGGDTRRRTNELIRTYPALAQWKSGILVTVDDKRRFMDLTKTIDEGDGHIFYHRLDRLLLTYQSDRGSCYLGRQALTWGNGMLFNPMDLFNPFSPTDVDRDYKIGDDMARALFFSEHFGEFQLLYVPRRNPAGGDVRWNESSVAGKLHRTFGSLEVDLMGAWHYRDYVFGLGGTGYAGSTAWRLDITWTELDDHPDKSGYVSLDANLDYSWTWRGKNMYGFLEFFYNGLGQDRYLEAVSDAAILERLLRGELFTLGRVYLCGHIQLEAHPLVNIFLTLINNLEDPSGIVQPKLIWDIKQNLQLNAGGTLYYGATGTEYGGFYVAPYDFYQEPADSFFCILTYFF